MFFIYWILEMWLLFAIKFKSFCSDNAELLTQIVVGEHCYGTNVAPASYLWLTSRRCRLHKFWWEDNEQAVAGGWLFGTFVFTSKGLILQSIILFLKDCQFTFMILFHDDLNVNSFWPLSIILLDLIAFWLCYFLIIKYQYFYMVTCSFYNMILDYEVVLIYREIHEWLFLLVVQEWQRSWLLIWRAVLNWKMLDLTGKYWALMCIRFLTIFCGYHKGTSSIFSSTIVSLWFLGFRKIT